MKRELVLAGQILERKIEDTVRSPSPPGDQRWKILDAEGTVDD